MIGAKELIKFSDRIRILYVEDDEKLREDTGRLLGTFFKNLTLAENGRIAMEKYKPGEFDIVISDFVMPEMDGMELTRQIKAIDKDQVLIILSAHDELHFVEEFRAAGVDDFIFKPLNIKEFIDTMHKACLAVTEKKD
ncbi:response regulator [bacterium]|nr:response regulator [bacterium]